jgi:Zn-finger nucleic acid-binding protein
MQCPLCKKHTMASIELAPNLVGLACGECAGIWIARTNYDAWRAKHPGDLPEQPVPVEMAVTDTHKAKTCPQCGHLLLPYQVGHGLSFSIDHCGTCGGVWLDRNEWDAIKAGNLHASLHEIVSSHWQAAVRRSDAQESIEQTYKRLLGASYGKASEVRAWVREQPQKSLILAYLSDVKPKKK